MVPVLMTAGVLQYPGKRFFAALAAERSARFLIVALLGRMYGKAIINVLQKYYHPALYTLIGLAVLGGVGALVYFKWYRPKRQRQQRREGRRG